MGDVETETIEIANHRAASMTLSDGTPVHFEPDVAVAVPAVDAATVLAIKDSGFFTPGNEPARWPDDPLLADAERRGRTIRSPFPPPDSDEMAEKLQVEQAALDAAEAARLVALDGPAIPPRSGRGSGAKAWADYATLLGHPVYEEMSRDEILRLLESKGLPTVQGGDQGPTATVGEDDSNPDQEPGPDVSELSEEEIGSAERPGEFPEDDRTGDAGKVFSEVDPETSDSEVDPDGDELEDGTAAV